MGVLCRTACFRSPRPRFVGTDQQIHKAFDMKFQEWENALVQIVYHDFVSLEPVVSIASSLLVVCHMISRLRASSSPPAGGQG
jgi:hypothetical protein